MPVREYQSEGVQDSVLKARLVNSYRAFTLRNHSYGAVNEQLGLEELRAILLTFFNEVGNSFLYYTYVCLSIYFLQ